MKRACKPFSNKNMNYEVIDVVDIASSIHRNEKNKIIV